MKGEKSEKELLGFEIRNLLDELRRHNGWSIDDLASYLEINTLTVRNSLSRGLWSDLVVTILKLKQTIPEKLAYEYKKATEREKIEKRKTTNSEEME